MFIWGDCGSRGCYDNAQPALRPYFVAVHHSAKSHVCDVSVCMVGARPLRTDCAHICVCESFVVCAVYIYSAQPQLQALLDASTLCPMPAGTERPKPTHYSSKLGAMVCMALHLSYSRLKLWHVGLVINRLWVQRVAISLPEQVWTCCLCHQAV